MIDPNQAHKGLANARTILLTGDPAVGLCLGVAGTREMGWSLRPRSGARFLKRTELGPVRL